MMELTLQRTHVVASSTFGELRITGSFHRLCYTLEDEVREVEGQPVSEWKIKGATAIPSGRYRITMENSPRFGPETLTVNDVPGFTGVRIHAGNTDKDTEGCPLLGFGITDAGIVPGSSRPAVQAIKNLVRGAIERGSEVWLTVSNIEAVA